MKEGIIKEEKVAKISITAKRSGEEVDEYIKIFLEKLMVKKKRMKSN